DISELNALEVADSKERAWVNHHTGLGIPGPGKATLQHAIVRTQPWPPRKDWYKDPMSYGGVVGLACSYAYTKQDGSHGRFTLYVEYLHLITPDFLPKDGNNNPITADTWKATGKGSGFGPKMQDHAQLSFDELTGSPPILVGYLGATQFPHVHIN